MDYYLVLGIAEDADEETIRSAFRALARRYHPDVGAGSSPVEFQRAREAHETLVDPERRRVHDRRLRASRARPTVVEDLIVSRSYAEPLFARPRVSFPGSGARVTRRESFLFDEIIEEWFASLHALRVAPRRWS